MPLAPSHRAPPALGSSRNVRHVVLSILVLAACRGEQEPLTAGGRDGPRGQAGGASSAAAGAGTAGASSVAGSGGNAGAGARAGASADAGASSQAGGRAGVAGRTGGESDAGDASAGASGASGEDGGAAGVGSSLGPDDVFRPSTRFTVIDPKDYGAEGDDSTDDADALQRAFDAVPASGGIVLFSAGTYLKKERLLRVKRDHTLLWGPNRRATIHGTVRSLTQSERDDDLCGVRQQAIVFQQQSGGGVHGLRFTSNATERTSCAEDCQMTLDTVDGMEVVGTEVSGGPGCSVFAWSSKSGEKSQNLYIEGNYFHHTYADSIHHTHGARRSHCWGNYVFNEAPSLGDDGIACVTYSPSDPRCGDMEWWGNFYLGGAHGRGMAVIGGEDIAIHDNWIVGSASAGLIVASESAYTSASSERIELRSNYLVHSPNGSVNNGHSAILVSGGNPDAEPIRDVASIDNVIVDPPSGRVERAEGKFDSASVVFDDSTDPARLPGPAPTLADVTLEDTSVLSTRDVSFVPAAMQPGLQRIHVREAGGGLEERFEYVVTASPQELAAWLVDAPDSYVAETRVWGERAYALVLAPTPLELAPGVAGVTFEELREGDRSGELSWLWRRLDEHRYEH
jgi:hypothetical protein